MIVGEGKINPLTVLLLHHEYLKITYFLRQNNLRNDPNNIMHIIYSTDCGQNCATAYIVIKLEW